MFETPIIFEIPCLIDSQSGIEKTVFTLYADKFSISTFQEIPLLRIQSIHTKDELNTNFLLRIKFQENTEESSHEQKERETDQSYSNYIEKQKALLRKDNKQKQTKVKSEGGVPGISVVVTFTKKNHRDFLKSVLLVVRNIYESEVKKLKDKNSLIQSKKNLLSNFPSIIRHFESQELDVPLHPIIPEFTEYLFTNDFDTTTPSFILMLLNNKTICQIFLDFNITLNQFYNIYLSSYFYSISNKPNELDQAIFNQDKMNFAKRINLFSKNIIHTGKKEDNDISAVTSTSREVNFDVDSIVNCYVTGDLLDSRNDLPSDLSKSLHEEFVEIPLVLEEISEKRKKVDYEDFEISKELSRVIFKQQYTENTREEILNYSKELKNLLSSKYSKTILFECERLFPEFYDEQ